MLYLHLLLTHCGAEQVRKLNEGERSESGARAERERDMKKYDGAGAEREVA